MEALPLSPAEIQEIKSECNEMLNQVEEILTLKSANISSTEIDQLFRSFHSLKGVGGFISLPKMVDVAHSTENVLDLFRKTPQKLDTNAKEIIYDAIGIIKSFLENDFGGRKIEPIELEFIEKKSNVFFHRANEYVQTSNHQTEKTAEKTEVQLAPADFSVSSVPNGGFFSPVLEMEDGQAALDWSLKQLQGLMEDLIETSRGLSKEKANLTFQTLKNYAEKFHWSKIGNVLETMGLVLNGEQDFFIQPNSSFYTFTKEGLNFLYGLVFLEKNNLSFSLLNREFAEYQKNLSSFKTNIEKKQEDLYRRIQDTASFSFRIEVDVMAKIMKLVEGMVVESEKIQSNFKKLPISSSDGLSLKVDILRYDDQIHQLLGMMLQITRVPLKHLFFRFIRVIKNAAELVQKKIEFQMVGEEIEIDRALLEPLNISIIHLLRNACDHGIETQNERIKLGKKPVGTIVLGALVEGKILKISILDDGQGLKQENLKKKLIELKWFTEEELAKMTEKQIQDQIFRPGFSTNPSVTIVSGRGVGMDVVKKEMEKVKGEVEIFSDPGKSLEIVLKIPYHLV